MIRNQAFTVVADHDGAETDGYRMYVNGELAQSKPVSALQNGAISFADADGLPKGQYTLEVAAFNVDGETKSEPLMLVVSGVAPKAPVNVRIAMI